MHIAFLDTNIDRSALAARHASEVDKFRALMDPAAPGWRYANFRVTEGHFPEALAGFDGVMISGSPASVNDPTPWMARLEAVIREAVAAGVPVFGACLGHQAVAKALGGRVGRNPQGWVLGRIESRVDAPAPWMAGAGPRIALHAAHNEQVLALPPGAQVLGGTETTQYGHLAYGAGVFTTQYHPELTRAFMQDLIGEMSPSLDPAVARAARDSLSGPVGAAQMAGWIAAFFQQARP